jgi:hypothetical protein
MVLLDLREGKFHFAFDSSTASTCDDGLWGGDEECVDCGGSCPACGGVPSPTYLCNRLVFFRFFGLHVISKNAAYVVDFMTVFSWNKLSISFQTMAPALALLTAKVFCFYTYQFVNCVLRVTNNINFDLI